MKFMKRLTALFLSAACVCALVCVPPASAASRVSTFPDVTDPQVGRAVEALRTMGVVSGSGGKYDPNGSLTRAQFCKMAILVMGKGSEASVQANRTIFNDVPGKHWARGYVNLAAVTSVGETAGKGPYLMTGLGNGCFAPDRAITYGEAVTTLLRILGYARDANRNWPNGAVSTAAAVGLNEGLPALGARDTITRAQAAILFCNMLVTPVSGSEQTYLASRGCTLESGSLLLSRSATVNGQSGLVRIFTKNGEKDAVKPAAKAPAAFLEGAQGTAVYNEKGLFLTFLPDTGATSRTITVAGTNGRVLTATDGTQYTPSLDTDVWGLDDGKTPYKYSAVHSRLQPGTSLTLCFSAAGTIDYLFVHGTPTSLTGGVMVARNPVSGNPFAQLTAGSTDYKIVKNGAAATLADLQQYDVASFAPANSTLYVTDFRLTGIYAAATPNTAMPTSVTVLGQQLDVLDCAVDDLKDLKLNTAVTFLLSPDGKVAGAVNASTLRSNTVGYVDGSDVHLLNAPASLSSLSITGSAANYADCLVTVTGTTNGLSFTRLTSRSPSGALDLKARTLGGVPLADNVAVFDRVANSGIQPVSLADVAVNSVPASKVAYHRTNAAGQIDLLVLDDVTGDLYTYGIADVGEKSGGAGDMAYSNRTTIVTGSSGTLETVGGTSFQKGQFIGLAASTSMLDGLPRTASSVALKSVEKVAPSNFNLGTEHFFSGSVELPIADGVQCYNAQTKDWFKSGGNAMDNLRACLAYSNSLTVYYDRDPGQGGKVRIVVAN